jgi:AGCS family alanine or glycine:cation symporter
MSLEAFLTAISDFLWGPVTMILILGTGLYLSIGLRGMSILRIPQALKLMISPASRGDAKGDGEISPFAALMTALSATVGVGNIAGVATAIHLGGPGALFWMWMTALVGMATKYAETLLAVTYREVSPRGHYLGGPMYYIKHGLGTKWAWLGTLFAVFAASAAFGVGNIVQTNSIADALNAEFDVPVWATAVTLTVLVFAVIIGGIKRIAVLSSTLIPFMIILYFVGGVFLLIANASEIPAAFDLIFTSAFNGTAATGGFAGAAVAAAIRFGVARGIFSNEAGLGTAAIAQAAARSDDPVRNGAIGMLGTFIDSLVVNSMTGIAIITTGVWMSGETGAPLTAMAYNEALPGFGGAIVSISLIFFAFTTILGWSLYGERSAAYLFGDRAIVPYRYLWAIVIPVGALSELEVVWILADIMNALMAIPNLIALLLLSPVVFKITRDRLGGGQTLMPTKPKPRTD